MYSFLEEIKDYHEKKEVQELERERIRLQIVEFASRPNVRAYLKQFD